MEQDEIHSGIFGLGLESIEDEGVCTAIAKTKESLAIALDRVAYGMLGVESVGVIMPTYPGLLSIWHYARDVRKAVKLAEDDARIVTSDGVNKIGNGCRVEEESFYPRCHVPHLEEEIQS